MSLGNTLRMAREAQGITTSELAARTHMLVQIVEGLENEDFRRIPAPIYGRGFIKLYCEAVNLDPKPLQAEFMELFNRPKDAPGKAEPAPVRRSEPLPTPPVRHEIEESRIAEQPPRPVEPSPASVPVFEEEGNFSRTAPAAEPEVPVRIFAEPPAVSEFGELFSQPATPAAPAPAQPVQQPARRSYGDLFGQTYAADDVTAPKPSAAEKFRTTMSNVSSGVFANVQKLPPNTGRIITVSILAIIVLTLIGWGITILYKATTPGETAVTEPPVPAETAEAEGPAPVEKKKAEEKKAGGGKTESRGKTTEKKKSSENRQTAPDAAVASKTAPDAAPGDLKSSGIEIPALYID